jgi:hypothetical protein
MVELDLFTESKIQLLWERSSIIKYFCTHPNFQRLMIGIISISFLLTLNNRELTESWESRFWRSTASTDRNQHILFKLQVQDTFQSQRWGCHSISSLTDLKRYRILIIYYLQLVRSLVSLM